MPVNNPRFEIPGAYPGDADGWTLRTFVAGERIAAFGPAPSQSSEDFESWHALWASLDAVDVVRAFFHGAIVGYDAFDGGWRNDRYVRHLPAGHVIVAPFGGTLVEDMDTGWGNAPYYRYWTDVAGDLATFDGDGVETMSVGWRNDAFAQRWADVASATVVLSDGSELERFKGVWSEATSI